MATLINRFLSLLSYCSDQGIEAPYGFSGTPCPVPQRLPSRVINTAYAFPWGQALPSDPKALRALALYREGATINSVPYQFLSFFKILNILWNDRWIQKRNEMVDGLRDLLPKLNDPAALDRLAKIRKQETDVATYLYESGRCAIAHAYRDDHVVDPDAVSDLHRLSEDLHIVRAVARHIIEHKFKINGSIMGHS